MNGEAQVEIQSVTVEITDPTVSNIPTISTYDIDYTWYTPGGGGGCSYTPFPN